MPTIRVMSPATARSPIAAGGQSYTQQPGQVLDVPDAHADVLCANGWIALCQSGPTSARPTTRTPGRFVAQAGDEFFDATLGKLLVFDGVTWRDPANGAAV